MYILVILMKEKKVDWLSDGDDEPKCRNAFVCVAQTTHKHIFEVMSVAMNSKHAK